MSRFKQIYSYDDRLLESTKIKAKYPDRVPIICEQHHKTTLTLDKQKYLVPITLTVGQFSYIIRKRLKVTPEQAIFLMIDKMYPSIQTEIGNLYNEYKDDDGFLYITFHNENTFGSDDEFDEFKLIDYPKKFQAYNDQIEFELFLEKMTKDMKEYVDYYALFHIKIMPTQNWLKFISLCNDSF